MSQRKSKEAGVAGVCREIKTELGEGQITQYLAVLEILCTLDSVYSENGNH